jgi:hypothetical protein
VPDIRASHKIVPGEPQRGPLGQLRKAAVTNFSAVEPCTVCDGSDNGAPEGILDSTSKLGLLMGVYAQNEWKITDQLTMNAGLRFDQMYQFVAADQLSPRISFTYKPSDCIRSGYYLVAASTRPRKQAVQCARQTDA